MIDLLIHTVFHKLAEEGIGKLTNENATTPSKLLKSEENLNAIKAKREKILKDCQKAVLLCSENKSATLDTKKWDCKLNSRLVVDTLVKWGYPKVSALNIKTVAGWEPVSFTAYMIAEWISEKQGLK